MRSSMRASVGLAEAILGAGLLLVPPAAFRLAGDQAPAAWLTQLAGGALFCLALGLLAHARTGPGSVAEVTGQVLGRAAGRVSLGGYVVGFVVGQAAIASAAGWLFVAAVAGGGRATAVIAGLVVLGLATAGAFAGIRLSERARRARLVATLGLAVFGCVHPELFGSMDSTMSTVSGGFWPAVFVVFFAGVGWERITRIGPALATRGQVVAVVVLGASLVAGIYLAAAVLLGSHPLPWGAPAPLTRLAALVTAIVLGLYCLTNVDTTAGFVRQLGGPTGPATTLAVGVACMAVLGLATLFDWGTLRLLFGPAVATWVGYLLATAATVRGGPWAARLLGGIVLAALLALAPLTLISALS